MRGGRLPGLEAGGPCSFVAPPLAACWPSVAFVDMGMLFLARPVGRPAGIPSIAAGAVRARTGQPGSGRLRLAQAGSGWLAADQEHCRVIIERVADVAQHVGTQVVQDLVGVAGLAEG